MGGRGGHGRRRQGQDCKAKAPGRTPLDISIADPPENSLRGAAEEGDTCGWEGEAKAREAG